MLLQQPVPLILFLLADPTIHFFPFFSAFAFFMLVVGGKFLVSLFCVIFLFAVIFSAFFD